MGNIQHHMKLAEMAVISDCKNPETANIYTAKNTAEIQNINNYYSFGMPLHRRNYTSANGSYRFGFNGQEKDDEIYGDGNMNSAQYWEYDTRLGRRWNLDPKPTVGISNYACFANNPIWYRDINGDSPTWHQDKAGNLVADAGDNEYTLQNFIWRNTGAVIVVQQAIKLLKTLLKNNPDGVTNIAGKTIYLNDVRNIAGSHISTMLNPGTKSVHKGQRAFLESEQVQFTLTVMSFFIPVAGLAKTIKASEQAVTHLGALKLTGEVMGYVTALIKAYDNASGTNQFKYNSLPAEIVDNVGYPNAAEKIDAAMSLRSLAKNIKSGNIIEATDNTKDLFKSGKNKNSKQKDEKENSGYEGSK